jgi:hypothetical protein
LELLIDRMKRADAKASAFFMPLDHQHLNSAAAFVIRSAIGTSKGQRASQLWQPMQSAAVGPRAR